MKSLFVAFGLATVLLIAWSVLFGTVLWMGDPSCDPQSGVCPSDPPELALLGLGLPWLCWLLGAVFVVRRLRKI